MRINVDLTAAQLVQLARVAAREGISRAEAVRRAIDATYPESKAGASAEAIRRRAFGLWLGRNVDAKAYVEARRDEWDR